jgi:hypothetical protein
LCIAAALSVVAAFAQNGYLTITSPSAKVMVNGQMQLSAAITDLNGTPLDLSGLTWTVSDATVATIAADGTLKGLFPGDVTITASDSNTGATATVPLHIIPLSIAIQAITIPFHVGDTMQLSATAFDAANKIIPGLQFEFRSGEPAIASIGSGGITAIAEGFTTVEARIAVVSRDPALAVTMPIHVLPAPAYKIKKLISTDVAGNTTIAAFSAVSAVSPNEIASIVTLANGNQAAILIEGGKQKVLAVAGQDLPNARRMVLRIDAISANSKGDVAMLIEYPQQFCAASVFLFPYGQPEQEVGPANCGNGLNPRSLGEDGSVLYRSNDQIYTAKANSAPKLLFSIATQPTAKDPVRNVNDFYPSRAGTFVMNTNLTSGAHIYLHFDGKTLSKVYQDGDVYVLSSTNSMDNVVGSSDGTFYARINGNGFAVLVKLVPGAPFQTLAQNGDPVTGGSLGWVQGVTDASSAGVIFMCDLSVGPYHSSLCAWDGKKIMELAPADGYAATISATMLSNGTAVAYASLLEPGAIPGLRTITTTGTQTVILAAGTPFAQPVPAGVDWHYASRGGSSTVIPFRATGDAIMNASDSPQAVVTLGAQFARGKNITWIGAAIGNESGDIVFPVGYPQGNALLRYRGGKLDPLLDTGIQGTGPSGTNISSFSSGRNRQFSMNNRGDVAFFAPFNGVWTAVLYTVDGKPQFIAQQNTAAPGGSTFTNNFPSITVDDSGRVLFTAVTADGFNKVFLWDGKTVQRVIGIGDIGPNGLALNEVSNIAGSGPGFLLALAFGGYATRELRYFDGVSMKVLESTDTTALDAAGLSYFWANECTLAANGDAHFMASTSDGGVGVYAHRGAKDAIVARTRDQLPGGEWLIMPLSVSSSVNGEVYFTAYVWLNGVEALALYEAIPQ